MSESVWRFQRRAARLLADDYIPGAGLGLSRRERQRLRRAFLNEWDRGLARVRDDLGKAFDRMEVPGRLESMFVGLVFRRLAAHEVQIAGYAFDDPEPMRKAVRQAFSGASRDWWAIVGHLGRGMWHTRAHQR